MQAIFSFILHYRKFFLMAKIVDWDSHIGRRLRLRDLHVFFTVAQHGSLARAASHLGVSHPAVSQLIADLERASVRLFDRSSAKSRRRSMDAPCWTAAAPPSMN